MIWHDKNISRYMMFFFRGLGCTHTCRGSPAHTTCAWRSQVSMLFLWAFVKWSQHFCLWADWSTLSTWETGGWYKGGYLGFIVNWLTLYTHYRTSVNYLLSEQNLHWRASMTCWWLLGCEIWPFQLILMRLIDLSLRNRPDVLQHFYKVWTSLSSVFLDRHLDVAKS